MFSLLKRGWSPGRLPLMRFRVLRLKRGRVHRRYLHAHEVKELAWGNIMMVAIGPIASRVGDGKASQVKQTTCGRSKQVQRDGIGKWLFASGGVLCFESLGPFSSYLIVSNSVWR